MLILVNVIIFALFVVADPIIFKYGPSEGP